MSFAVGQVVVRRFLHTDGRFAAVQTARVVADDERGLLLRLAVGSGRMRRVRLDGTPTRSLPVREELAMPTMLGPAPWGPYRSLVLMPPGARHSVSSSWTADGTFVGWYVNLESAPVRWRGGVDVHDQALDLRITPAREVSWKDEDEFAARIGDPLFFSAEEAHAIRAEGERVAADAARAAFPFDRTITAGPDECWAPVPLPPWWDVPADGADRYPSRAWAAHSSRRRDR